ncbi:CheR family methyltransferase [Arthrospira platensis]|jgi:chemotaxis protein methyltransferase CheR|uniref:protein-glutamate O-methyltransferase n=2 Tax=Limnospira platensis TaxID=118562 RepID=A0A5M3T8G3_LIMPL|nr:CheR family methyltransferase [Arthrospira platensis]AMW28880.1 chemotaxis protein CheR [Arthrospira platensis YZ]KDR55999.1 chemotaxis protein CheR [Arthrospira platensis str. Paraca]MBD2669783.1 tetratricopeptide repeat protein [Arthrospira platensis FACHB-439]MBD2710356.1 tetratricopeptide repeat protein [Arthrospira platensis FACHB-835]MDT9183009.1 CheR family methyltransferase [Limnospira sp. PMC 289.06]MDT9295158.1 CheR family methyltransferase [Arthrospira platensis PCC 7345]MDT931
MIQQLIQLITTMTGLHIRPQDYGTFSQKIWRRVQQLHLSSLNEYYNLLTAANTESKTEWSELMPLLTTTETYFFRDRGQFKLLREVILPELIAARKSSKTLRLWSAGCSTGEEAYSLAILVQQLLPDWPNWLIEIIGTDVNEVALQRARDGVYSHWSFRMVDPEVQRQYFYPQGQNWLVNPAAKSLVRFLKLNLVSDNCTNAIASLGKIDLILCRNVFVYFEKPYIVQVLRKFYQVLRPGGYLMTAHAEIQGLLLDEFKSHIFPESVIYQREKPTRNLSVSSPNDSLNHQSQPLSPLLNTPYYTPNGSRLSSPSQPPANHGQNHQRNHLSTLSIVPPPVASIPTASEQAIAISQSLEEAQKLINQKAYNEALKKVQEFVANHPHNFDAHYLMAQIHANSGQHDAAIVNCQKALEINSLSIDPYYILLHISQEKGDWETAKIFAKRIIYLSDVSASSICAHMELATVHEREGNLLKAKKLYLTALSLLNTISDQSPVPYLGKISAGELTAYLQQKLNLILY